jgi:predicted small lipoprotein YifL
MSFVRQLLLLLVLAAILAACGVRGDTEPPPGSDPDKHKNRPIVLDKLI